MNPADKDALINAVEQTFADVGIDLYQGAAWLKRYVDEYSPILNAALSPIGSSLVRGLETWDFISLV